ncbi:MAG: MerR family transcriptional regulator [Actinomycetota bacterium]|nr:MerR family transcriptional regulator [Actinomycetota bacterium]
MELGTATQTTGKRLLRCGEVARLTGLSVKALHHYEEKGLVESVGRTEAGHRLYGEEEVARLTFIKRAKLLGLTLKEIRGLVSLAAGRNRGEIMSRLEEILEEKLEETERRIGELSAFRERLLSYRRQVLKADPLEKCETETGFCGCLEAATGGGYVAGDEGRERGTS